MSWFFRMPQTAERIRHKAATVPGYEVPLIDTAMGQTGRNARVIQKREADIARRHRGPNEGCDTAMLAMGVRVKAEMPAAYASNLENFALSRGYGSGREWIARDPAIRTLFAKLFSKLTPDEIRAVIMDTAGQFPNPNSTGGQSMTPATGSFEAVIDAGRFIIKRAAETEATLTIEELEILAHIRQDRDLMAALASVMAVAYAKQLALENAATRAAQAEQLQEQQVAKSDYKIPAGLFQRSTAAMRTVTIKKDVPRIWYQMKDGNIDLARLFKPLPN